jgi:lysophospholipase L1-like esterase
VIKIFLLIIAVVLIGQSIRALVLFRRSQQLFNQANAFPRQYELSGQDPVLRVAVLGDSTLAGEGVTKLEQTLPYLIVSSFSGSRKISVTNFAISGAKTRDVLEKQWLLLKDRKFDLIIIQVGANDATHLTPLSSYRQTWRELLIKLEKYPKVIIASPPDFKLTPALVWPVNRIASAHSQAENAILEQLLKGTQFQYVDLFHNGRLDPNAQPSLYASDSFHPSPAGYALWANVYKSTIKF